MPSGKTHLKLEAMILFLWTALSVLCVLKQWIEPYQAVLFLCFYLFSMLFLSPDLDLSKSDAFARWGPLRWVWLPYAWLFRHRQISHHPLWGPLSRITTLAVVFLLGILVYQVATGKPAPRFSLSPAGWAAACVGLYLPNLEHIVADRLTTTWLRKSRRRRL